MIEIISYTSLFLCSFYLLLVALLTIGLFRFAPSLNPLHLPISIIIPARNEENNIQACLKALALQTYPTDKIEIILVNDRSTDLTVSQAQACNLPNLKIISITHQEYLCPKKNAIHQGIMASQGEIIFTTDADCRPEPNWVLSTVQCFGPHTGMILGYAPLSPPPGLFNPLLGLQSLIVAALSAGSAGIGYPVTCTGRNLAYRRKAYDAVNGFDGVGHLIGGDDIFLMNKMAQSPFKIAFNQAPQARVPSQVHTDSQLNRQLRYQSKSLHYGFDVLLPALAVYIFHLILFLLPMWFFLVPELTRPLGLCLIVKTFADAIFLLCAAKRFNSLQHMKWFPLLEVLLYPYIVIVCALGALIPTKWK